MGIDIYKPNFFACDYVSLSFSVEILVWVSDWISQFLYIQALNPVPLTKISLWMKYEKRAYR